MASFIYWIQLLLYSGVVLYAPSLALEATTGMSKTASIIIIGLVCAFYSSIGGIKAVLITDVFQGLLMFASVFLIIGTAANEVGGLGQIWEIARQGERLEFDRYRFDFCNINSWIIHTIVYALIDILLLLQNWSGSDSEAYLVVSYAGWLMYIFITLRSEPSANTAYADCEVGSHIV